LSTDRSPAVAGTFYPSNPVALRDMVREMLSASAASNNLANVALIKNPDALIVPHAGYVYSGQVAARAYASIQPSANEINRVVLLGPAHRVALRGMALSSADNFQTPLGTIPLDKAANTHLGSLPQVVVNNDAHALEHSLEVQLPFLQEVLGEFKLVPIVVGETSPEDVYTVLNFFSNNVSGDRNTLLVISTDLSHFETYENATSHDRNTNVFIKNLDYENINYGDACGRNPLNGLLYFARKKNLQIQNLALQNSGDVSGEHDRVVGYGAYVLH